MRDILVALDLETTGLDPAIDRIIEVGAVKFQGDRILEEFQTLVDPGRSVPSHITHLTGLRDKDFIHAPIWSEVLPQVKYFVGDAPVVGHNIRFDIEFLRQNGIPLDNPLIDTFVLASVTHPSLPRYSLSSLVSLFDLEAEDAHRALNDSFMTAGLYQRLWEKAFELPINTLSEIVEAGKNIPWDGRMFFAAVLRERMAEAKAEPADDDLDITYLFPPHRDENGFGKALNALAASSPELIDADQLAAEIEPDGLFDQALPNYEYRPQQVAMLRSVANAFNEGQHLLLEAPTGVGKSLAYLLPAINFAQSNKVRVVISTHTINLQEQLINKDIPLLREVSETPFRATVLKGRSHYLCPSRFAMLRRRGPNSPEEMLMLARLLVWLTTGTEDERQAITLRGAAEAGIWRRLSAEGDGCTLGRCADEMGGQCPFYKARRAAESAHIVIVNHSLLLADVVAENRVLPEYNYLIIDEGHHLEAAITNSMSFRADAFTIRRQLADLGTSRRGLLADLLHQTRSNIPSGYYSTLEEYVGMVEHVARHMAQHSDQFFEVLQNYLKEQVNIPRNEYTQRIRIVDNLRAQPGWVNVESNWERLSEFTSGIAQAMNELVGGLQNLSDYDIDGYSDLLFGVQSMARYLNEIHLQFDHFVRKPDGNYIYWVEFQPGSDFISLHAAPLRVGQLVQEHLWQKKDTIVLASATLQTDGSFSHIRDRLDAEGVSEVAIDSPFDYESNTLLYLVNDIPEPADRAAYQTAVEQGILNLCRATKGRALILFTSYAQLRQTSSAIGDELAKDGILLFDQSGGGSQAQLLDGFIESERAVLMGTRTFWEGVDIPGADLSVLVIVRLPFSVPTDPLFAARSEQFSNSFYEYALPEAILRFRQGFGRLIRRKDDRGIVAIFDKRVISKSYGNLFLEALPQCTLHRGRLADLPGMAMDWLSDS